MLALLCSAAFWFNKAQEFLFNNPASSRLALLCLVPACATLKDRSSRNHASNVTISTLGSIWLPCLLLQPLRCRVERSATQEGSVEPTHLVTLLNKYIYIFLQFVQKGLTTVNLVNLVSGIF